MYKKFFAVLISCYSFTAFSLEYTSGSPNGYGNPSILIDAGESEMESLVLYRRSTSNSSWLLLSPDNYGYYFDDAISRYRLEDFSVTVGSTSTEEFQYKIGGNPGVWVASCEVYDEALNPLQAWADRVNEHPFYYGHDISLLVNDDPDIPLNEKIIIPPPTEQTVVSQQNAFWMLSNDKYVAIFSYRGGLLAFTHRTYGMEFQDSLRYNSISPIFYKYGCEGGTSGSDCAVSQWQQTPTGFPDLSSDELVFQWQFNDSHSSANVKVTWSLESFSRTGLHGSVQIEGGGDEFGFVQFPNMIGLGHAPECSTGNEPECSKLYLPNNISGTAYPLNTSRSFDYLAGQSAQFSIVEKGDYVLYVGAEDSTGYPKKFSFNPNSTSTVSGVQHYLRDGYQISPQDEFDIVIRPMCGTWDKAAKNYRDWAVQQEWTPAKLGERQDVSSEAKQGMFWFTQFNSANWNLDQNADYVEGSYKRLFREMDGGENFRIGVHHYMWWEASRFDVGYPRYTPKCAAICGADDWGDYMQSLQADGNTFIMPYINGSYIDITNVATVDPTQMTASCNLASKLYPEEGIYGEALPEADGMVLSNDLVIGLDNKPITGVYSSGQCLGKMDLNSSSWQTVIEGLVNVNANAGVTAQYLDSFGAGYYPNLDPIGGYQPGHSHYMKDGTREIADIVKSTLRETDQERFIASEHYNEQYLKHIDLITMYSGTQPDSLTPLMSSVYSGYQNVVGMQLRQQDSYLARKYRLSNAFLWGYQLGLTSFAQLVDEVDINVCNKDSHENCDYASAVYAFNLSNFRQQQLDILAYGEFMQTVLPVNSADYADIAKWCEDRSCTIFYPTKFPLLQAAHWKDRYQNNHIVVTNPTQSTQQVKLELPISLRSLAYTDCQDKDGLELGCIQTKDINSITVSINSLETVLLSFNQYDDSDSDGTLDNVDNCPNIANPNQTDSDDDGVGNVCDVETVTVYSHGSQDGWLVEWYEDFGQISPGGQPANEEYTKIGDRQGNRQMKGLFSFDLSAGVPSTSTIISASLNLTTDYTLGDPASLGEAYFNLSVGGFNGDPSLSREDFTASATVSNAAVLDPSLVQLNTSISPNGVSAMQGAFIVQLRGEFTTPHNGNDEWDSVVYYTGLHPVQSERPNLVVEFSLAD